jgi:peroxiredoxin
VTVRRQWLVIAGVAGALAVALLITITRFGDELFPLAIGSRAPDFRAAPIDGAPVAKGIADYAGDVVLLNLWATWCVPCRAEMPSMERLEQRLGAKGLRIVAVSIDNPGMDAAIRAFRDEFKLTFEILHDAPGEIRQRYQTTGVPESFVIGRDGRIRRRIIGADDWSSAANVAFFERLLAEPAER